jgi:NADPH-dependent glutamate synthase beta subunit-like oxidoreductase
VDRGDAKEPRADTSVAEHGTARSVLVVGGDVAALTAALDLADGGAEVHLVEKEPFLGDALKQRSTFPDSETPAYCSAVSLARAVRTHPRIHVMTSTDVTRISRTDGALTAKLRSAATRVTDACDACGACVLVCPVKPYDTFNEGLTLRTAIDWPSTPFHAARPNIEREIPACQEACPVHIDIRRYVGLVAEGDYTGALAVIRERNPLPAICGRVCNHPCESACNRGWQDEPLSIDALKRFVADYEVALRNEGKLVWPAPPRKTRKEKTAIVGAGPAGLTVAHDLALAGFSPTVFEAAPVPGGMLYLGIPEYRLPRDVIRLEVEYIANMGVGFHYETPIGPDLTLDDLRNQGFKAIFLGIGAHKGLKLRVPGEDDYEGVADCIAFLRRVNLGETEKPGEKVIVIGGGNSAIDAARTALRLGCDEVHIVYRRSLKEMPANPWEIEAAQEEGVKISYLAAPTRILGENGRVTGMECVRMQLGKLDASGRRRPVPVEGSEFTIDADVIVPAISQSPDTSFLPDDTDLELSRWGSFVVDESNGATNVPGVFSGGDAVTGPSTVIWAIEAGHRAARGIVDYLSE